MAECRIFKPTKSAMQSGKANTKKWILEFEPTKSQKDRLMGWVGSSKTTDQIRITFNSKDEAISFAKKNNLKARVDEPKKRNILKKNYSDNFSFRFRFQ